MPGIILSPTASSEGATAAMKRAHAPQQKKRRVVHALHHTQPLQHIPDPISAEFDSYGESKDFFDQQLRRAIAIQCRSIGFEGARPDALEEFRALVDSCMPSLCDGTCDFVGLTRPRHDQFPSPSTDVYDQLAPHRNSRP